jgi:gliding motility-associated-like protein
MSRLSGLLSIEFIAIYFILQFPLSIYSQNLIRNGSFEYIDSCPYNPGQISLAYPWFTPNMSSPDLLNSCNFGNYGVPDNIYGSSNAQDGNGYALLGLGNYIVNLEYAEYISIPIPFLPYPNSTYIIEFYLKIPQNSKYSTNEFAYCITENAISSSQQNLFSISNSNEIQFPFLNTNNWQKVSDTINLNSDCFLTLGWFKSIDSISKLVSNNLSPDQLIVYLDNVSLYPIDYHPHLHDTVLCMPEELKLQAPYYPDMQYSWYYEGQWLSDSSSLYAENPATGWYVLHYTDFRNDSYIDSVYVEVQDCGNVELPNVFTPNNDGVHDIWAPISKDIDQLDVQIFNRWGKLVHQYSGSASSYSGWDGGDSPDGTYFAVVKAKGNTGRVMEEKGTLSLLR